MRYGEGLIEIGGRSFRVSDIEEVRVLRERSFSSVKLRRMILSVSVLITLILGPLKIMRVFSGEADFWVTLIFLLVQVVNLYFLYTGAATTIGGRKGQPAESAIQIRVKNRYIEILRSQDAEYVSGTASQLRNYLDKFRLRSQ